MSLRSALHIAALRGNVNVMRMLLETRCLNCRPTESSSCSKYPKPQGNFILSHSYAVACVRRSSEKMEAEMKGRC